MIYTEINSYISSQYLGYKETISEISKSSGGKILVKDHRKIYNFDSIVDELCAKNKPASADGLLIGDKCILFIEFKTGFKKKITEKSFDQSKLLCPYDENKICEPYGKILLKKHKLERHELLDSIHLKAVESYIMLEKQLLPHGAKLKGTNIKLMYCVVIDDYNDSEEDMLYDMTNKKSEDNIITSVKQSLRRYKGCYDANQNSYYYDDIKVFSPYEMICYLDSIAYK